MDRRKSVINWANRFWIVSFIISPLLVSTAVSDGQEMLKLFFSICSLLMFFLFTVIRAIFFGINLQASSILLTSAVPIALLAFSYSQHHHFINPLFVLNDIVLSLSIVFLIGFFTEERNRHFVLVVLTGLLAALILWGGLQIFDLIPHNSPYFLVTGPFGNPGPLASILTSLLPVPLCLLYIQGSTNISMVKLGHFASFKLAVLIVLGVGTVISTGSRTAFVVVVFTLAITWFRIGRHNWLSRKWRLAMVFSACLLTTLILIFFYKRDSSIGRFLIARVVIEEGKATVFGNGYGFFARTYNLFQSEYFSTHPNPNSVDAKAAGNVTYAYNEFLEVIINFGWIGLLFATFFIVWIVKSYRRELGNSDISFHCGFIILVIVFIQCFFSYPFSMQGTKIIFVIALSLFLASSQLRKRRHVHFKSVHLVLCVFLIGLVITGRYIYDQISGYVQWNHIHRKARDMNPSNVLAELDSLTPTLGKNALFLTYYGRKLKIHGSNEKAAVILEAAKKYSSDPIIYYSLGECYSSRNDMYAVLNFSISIRMCPNRLFPRYLLMKHFLSRQDSVNAKRVADTISLIEPKVISPAALQIKRLAGSLFH